ncbi:hypothetical protein P154DRAFT_520938 [Amniculicola lignicola CBS 123094]|uniref:Uncharacterized protein n=1 Tax=Amniculicola lignicola CBS 123094 TaxID=1392246 RepID=A0A6A5WQL0_9PLEO|nr:hypothetical protein P154DRAFT_520938 [Amniculicola lignicola CBS 123094]
MKVSFILLATASSAQVLKLNIPRAPVEPLAPQPTLFKRNQYQEPCEEVSASWAALKPKATGNIFISAKIAYDCLKTVPVDTEGDLEMIAELKNGAQFQSNLAYLKDGIKTHNAAPVDIMGSLDNIAQSIKKGNYKNEYDVQMAIRLLFLSAQDNHLNWIPDIKQILFFVRSGGSIISLSKDGIALPEVYLLTDVVASVTYKYTPSPLKLINGNDATEYLYKISDQANFHDPDARYQTLFPNPAAQSINGGSDGPFVQGELYDGPDTTYTFKNGSTLTLPNVAMIQSTVDFTGVTDGASFFKKFCSGPQPTSTPAKAIKARETSVPVGKPVPAGGYPTPVIVQSSLAIQCYYLNATGYQDVAVLAMPDFGPTIGTGTKETNPLVESQKVLRAFFADAVKRNKKKLIIDLRGNGGGTIDMGFEVFKQLFPTIEPYGATRYRAHEAFKVMSAAAASFAHDADFKKNHPDDYQDILSELGPLFYGAVVNKDGQPFKDFKEYYGPYTNNGDTFIAPRRYNFSDPDGHTAPPFNVTGYGTQTNVAPQPFLSENIVILQDGYCSSTCSIFSELMKEQGHVKTIAIGGRPRNEPMQGIGGTKGAQVLSFPTLIYWGKKVIQTAQEAYGDEVARQINRTALGRLVDTKQLYIRSWHGDADTPIYARFNSLDNLRMNDTTETPLEFVYEAADCRLFYTFESTQSPVPLWQQAVDAKWGGGKCVPGSVPK